jgi:2-polyprenyl-3-methyl-5-hydroxy-6-metoxy-1,4-benzoquinol methylase
MNEPALAAPVREQAYGQQPLTWVDRLGVYLSKRGILRHLPRRSDLNVLDLGCGYQATLLRALLPHLTSGLGIDVRISPQAKQQAKLSFIESTIEAAVPELEEDRFDLILLISVLEHLWEPLPVLEHCRRVLQPGGMLFVNVPTWRGKYFLEFSAFRLGTSPALEMDDHKMYYNRRDLWPLLVRAGFKPSRIKLKYNKFGLNLFAVIQKELG